MGCLLGVLVQAADISDQDGAALLLRIYHALYPLLQKIWADGAYKGDLASDLEAQYKIMLEVVSKQPEQKGFVVVPRRWVVERSLAWLTQGRRLVRDYERDPTYSEAWIWVSAIHRTVKHLAPNASARPAWQRREAA